MDSLLSKLQKAFPDLLFSPGDEFCWSPKIGTIIYKNDGKHSPVSAWSLLHEVGHALLGHHNYKSDLQLLEMESQAWEKAQEISAKFDEQIDPNHIEDCMDTYRDWLHQRSACPNCTARSLQQDSRNYRCFNCGQTWSVSSSRFCRPYRRKEIENKKSPQSKTSEATFV